MSPIVGSLKSPTSDNESILGVPMNYYADVIRLLGASSSIDWRELIYEVAARNPKSVIVALRALDGSSVWKDECKKLMQAGEKIAAIKLCRSFTNMSLAEAKEACEAL